MRRIGPVGVMEAGDLWAPREQTLYRLRNVDDSVFEQIQHGHRIIGTRNLLAHGYDIVDYEILWTVIERWLEPLELDLRSISE